MNWVFFQLLDSFGALTSGGITITINNGNNHLFSLQLYHLTVYKIERLSLPDLENIYFLNFIFFIVF